MQSENYWSICEIFSDDEGKIDYLLKDIRRSLSISIHSVLLIPKAIVSLYSTAKPYMAEAFYQNFNQDSKRFPLKQVSSDLMQVELVNDGPVTIILDTKINKKNHAC